ncbi:MAG: hypothetical protein RLY16_2394 [Bacteroidota bacterium]|jgi:S-formylglutathione hydrolase FrmB
MKYLFLPLEYQFKNQSFMLKQVYKLGSALLLLLISIQVFAAQVDTLSIPATKMKHTYKAAIVLPDKYAGSSKSFPVIYLLHGAWGHFDNWIKKTPDSNRVKQLADQYQVIFVLPEGEQFSFYLDSPIDPNSQFESYFVNDIIPTVDKKYRTIAQKKGRIITGLSMGGHGALYLSGRHPELFCAAGSMSGAVDLHLEHYQISEDGKKNFKRLFEPVLGPMDATPDLYAANSVIGLVQQMKTNKLALIIDCGVDDFLIEPNRELHRQLVYNQVPHDYIERPGAHNWPYWQDALQVQLLFFDGVLGKREK